MLLDVVCHPEASHVLEPAHVAFVQHAENRAEKNGLNTKALRRTNTASQNLLSNAAIFRGTHGTKHTTLTCTWQRTPCAPEPSAVAAASCRRTGCRRTCTPASSPLQLQNFRFRICSQLLNQSAQQIQGQCHFQEENCSDFFSLSM